MTTYFIVRPDGSLITTPEIWGAVSVYVSRRVREDATTRGRPYSPMLLALIDATAEAAHLMSVVEVPSSEPRTGPVGKVEITPAEAAARMGCSTEYARRLARRGDIRARKIGRNWLIDADDIDRETPKAA